MRVTVDVCDNCGEESRDKRYCPNCGEPLNTINKRRRPTPVPVEPVHAMADPLKRDTITLVTVRRVVTKQVPDYEADVLVRNGWERVA